MNQLNILLFGGSFNPPHLGHQFVIEQAFELIPDIDELWLLSTFNHSFGKDLASAPHRLKMCQLLIGNLSSVIRNQIKLCPIEIDYQTSGQTYQTLKLLQKETSYLVQKKLLPPNHQSLTTNYSFLIGSDQLPTFHQWGHYEQLLKAMTFYVYPRSGFPLKPLYPNMVPLQSPTQIITNLSSTLVKSRLKHNFPTNSLLPRSIQSYINHNSLYTPSL